SPTTRGGSRRRRWGSYAIRRVRAGSRGRRAPSSRSGTNGRRPRRGSSASGPRQSVAFEPPRPSGRPRAVHRRDSGWRLRWGMLVSGDLLASVLAYLAAWGLRMLVPLPFTRDYIPAVRFAEVSHHWAELVVLQLAALYFLGL